MGVWGISPSSEAAQEGDEGAQDRHPAHAGVLGQTGKVKEGERGWIGCILSSGSGGGDVGPVWTVDLAHRQTHSNAQPFALFFIRPFERGPGHVERESLDVGVWQSDPRTGQAASGGVVRVEVRPERSEQDGRDRRRRQGREKERVDETQDCLFVLKERRSVRKMTFQQDTRKGVREARKRGRTVVAARSLDRSSHSTLGRLAQNPSRRARLASFNLKRPV